MNRIIYVNITEQSIALLLISDILGIDKYNLFLLYETFGNDLFLFFKLFKNHPSVTELTDFRIKRCFQYAHTLTPVLLGNPVRTLTTTEQRAYRKIHPFLFENKLKITGEYCDS